MSMYLPLHWLALISGSPWPILMNFCCKYIYFKRAFQWRWSHLPTSSLVKVTALQSEPSSSKEYSQMQYSTFFKEPSFTRKFWTGFFCPYFSGTLHTMGEHQEKSQNLVISHFFYRLSKRRESVFTEIKMNFLFLIDPVHETKLFLFEFFFKDM